MSNSLDPDQARHYVPPDLGPNLFAKVIMTRADPGFLERGLIRIMVRGFFLLILSHFS